MRIILLLLQLFLFSLNAKEELRTVSLQFPWLHQFQFAGYYMAKEKGFYKELGLDVNFKEMNSNVKLTKDVLNEVTNYSIGRSSLILDKINGKDVVALLAIFQNSPLVLLTLESSNIKTAADLHHKNIMLTNDARETVAIYAMMASNQISLNDNVFQKHSYNLNDLIQHKTDAMGAYISNEPYILELKKIPYKILNPSDYGFNFYDGILFTSQKELENNPLDVYHFYQATLKGWKYAFENIGESVNLIYNKYNTQNKSLDALLYEAYSLKELAYTPETKLGELSMQKVKEISKIYTVLGFVKQPIDKALDNFIYNHRALILSSAEQTFLKNKIVTYITEKKEPFYLYDNDSIYGIGIDIWENLAQNLGLQFRYETVSNSKIIHDRFYIHKQSVKLQLTHEDINYKNKISSNSIKKYKYAIATRNDKDFISKLIELNNQKVVLVKNGLFNQEMIKKYPKIHFIEAKNPQEALNLLSNGKVFAVIDLLPTLTHFIKSYSFSNLKISGTTPYELDLKYMVNAEDKVLISLLNKAIDTLTKTQIDQIEKKYFQVLYASHTDYSIIYKIGIPFLICLTIFGFYNYQLKIEISKRKLVEKELYKAATTDKLTKIYNRSKLDTIFKEHLSSTQRYDTSLSIIFFDIDNFKKINDTFGHSLADTVLIDLAQLTMNNIRQTDNIGRWGGEEFLIILPQTTLDQAIVVAHNLKEKVENFEFQIPQRVTCSFGVTQVNSKDTQTTAMVRVDKLMYDVKESGKNGVKAG